MPLHTNSPIVLNYHKINLLKNIHELLINEIWNYSADTAYLKRGGRFQTDWCEKSRSFPDGNSLFFFTAFCTLYFTIFTF